MKHIDGESSRRSITGKTDNTYGIRKAIKDISSRIKAVAEATASYEVGSPLARDEIHRLIKDLEQQMKQAAKNLEFEKAALLRDQIVELRRQIA